MIDELGWARPADRLARWPRLAALAREVGIARVDGEVAKQLEARGVTTHFFGYHRGSDGWVYRRGAVRLEGGTDALVGELMGDDADDETLDRLHDDVVDAIVRACSDGALTERALIVAAAAPALGPADAAIDVDTDELDRLEQLDPSSLPAGADPAMIERARASLAAAPSEKGADTTAPSETPSRGPLLVRIGIGLAFVAYFLHRREQPLLAMAAIVAAIACLLIGLIALRKKG